MIQFDKYGYKQEKIINLCYYWQIVDNGENLWVFVTFDDNFYLNFNAIELHFDGNKLNFNGI